MKDYYKLKHIYEYEVIPTVMCIISVSVLAKVSECPSTKCNKETLKFELCGFTIIWTIICGTVELQYTEL